MSNPLDEIRCIVDKNIRKLSPKISKADLELSDFYHKVERSKFNACQGYKAIIELQDILARRRELKQEMSTYCRLRKTLRRNPCAHNNDISRTET